MKKTSYITPVTNVIKVKTESLCAAVSGVGGNAGIVLGEGETPGTADGRRGRDLWDDEEEW